MLTAYRDTGTVPTVGEFDADFSALVARTFRDLNAGALVDTLITITARSQRHRARTADELGAILAAE